jgi:prevent-host-death family protein
MDQHRLTLSVSEARNKFGRLLDRVERGERIVITRYGKPIAAILPITDLELLAKSKRLSKKRT